MNRYRVLAVLLCAAALSCEENAVQELPTGPVPAARIRFFNFGVNAPGVNFFANDTKMTGLTATTGTAYSLGAAGGLYSGIAPGQYTLSGRIAAATDNDLAISTVTAPIGEGKHYSFYQSGFYNTTTKKVDAFIVEDPLPPAIDYSVAHVRFVNAISNANPMTLYARLGSAPATDTTAGVAIGTEVAYKAAGAFTALPDGVYDLRTRYTGSSTNVITRTAVSFSAGRVYTVSAFGDITITDAVTTNRRRLDNTANR